MFFFSTNTTPMRQSVIERAALLLPRRWAEAWYRQRHRALRLKAEVTEGRSMQLAVDYRDQTWVQALQRPMGVAPGLCNWLEAALRAVEVYYDVGAGYGFFSAWVKRLRPEADVHAFEADWKRSIFLEKNAFNNPLLRPWRVIERQVAARDSRRNLTLDFYVQRQKHLPTLVRIDHSQRVMEVLKGAKFLIRNQRTEWLIGLQHSNMEKQHYQLQHLLSQFEGNYLFRVMRNPANRYAAWEDINNYNPQDQQAYLYASPVGHDRSKA